MLGQQANAANRSILPGTPYPVASNDTANSVLFLDEVSKELDIAHSNLRDCVESLRSRADSIFGSQPEAGTSGANTITASGRAYSIKSQLATIHDAINELRQQVMRLNL